METEPIILPIVRRADKKQFFLRAKKKWWCLFDCEECSKVLSIILKWNGWSEKKRIKNGLKRAKVFNSVPLWSFALNNVKHTVHKIINKHLCETHSAQKSSTMEKKWVSRPTDDKPTSSRDPVGKRDERVLVEKDISLMKSPNQPTPTNHSNQPTNPTTHHSPEWGSWWRCPHRPQTPASTPTRSLTPANTSSVPREIHFCWSWCQPVTAGFCEICSQEMERGEEKVVTGINFDI